MTLVSQAHNLGALGRAAEESVVAYRPYVALIYIDVVEFEGTHIRKFRMDTPTAMAEVSEIFRAGMFRPDVVEAMKATLS